MSRICEGKIAFILCLPLAKSAKVFSGGQRVATPTSAKKLFNKVENEELTQERERCESRELALGQW